MKFPNTRERRQDRREFIYKWRMTIGKFYAKEGWTYNISTELNDWVERYARPEMGYNKATQNSQIWVALAKEYNRMCEEKLIQP